MKSLSFVSNLYHRYFLLKPISTSDLVLIISGLVIVYYAYYTRKLWKESVRQTFLQNTPIPALYLQEKNRNEYLILKNIGPKPMINIEIESWNIHFHNKKFIEKYTFSFIIPLPCILLSGDESVIETHQYYNGKEDAGNGVSPLISPNYSSLSSPIHVIFQDISGDKYNAIFQFGSGKLKMVGPIKKFTLLTKITMKISDCCFLIKEPFLRLIILRNQNKSK